MRIGIDVTNFYSGLTNGTPIYLYNLVRGLVRTDPELELVLVYNHRLTPAAQAIFDDLSGERVRVVRTSFLRGGVPAGGWWYPRHSSIRRLVGDVDVFHAFDYLRPRPDEIPLVVSVLDVTTRLHPEAHQWLNRVRDGWKLEWARRAPDRIIAISEATRRDLVRLLGVDPERVDVTPLARGHQDPVEPAIGPVEARRRFGLEDAPYVLTVGTLEPRKNQARLIQAFESLPECFGGVRLVLAGGRGWKMDEIQRSIQRSPAAARIHTLGFVSADELDALYRGATVFAYPSLYEGFGLPLLEAMAAGVPVLTSTISSLPEVAGDAALLVDPLSVESIRSGLERLLADAALRRELSARSREREGEFTWERTARLTLKSYRRAIAERGEDRP